MKYEFNTSKEELKNFAEMSESYCHGGTGIREGEDEDNAKKYCERAEEAAENAEAYSEAIAPTFVINEETMELKQTGGKNIDFNLLDDGNLSFIVNNAEMAAKILGVVGISFKTEPYSADTHYSYYNALYYENSAYLCINKNGVQGVTPADDGVNWKYLCKGSGAELSGITAKDTEGLVGDAGADVAAQALLDELADRVANKLLVKTDFQNVLKGFLVNAGTTTLEGFAADARQLNDTIDGTLAKRVKNNEAEISELTSGENEWEFGHLERATPNSGYVELPSSITMLKYDMLFFTPEYASQNPTTYTYCTQIGMTTSGIYVRDTNGSAYTKPVSGYYCLHKKAT